MGSRTNLIVSLAVISVFVFVYVMMVNHSTDEEIATNDMEPKEKLKTSGAMESMDFLWTGQRAYPEAVVPDDKYYKAYEYSRANLQSQTDNAGEEWKQIGPHNIGGRTLAVEFNPLNTNTIYAGSASGGLWRSYSGGSGVSAWQYVPTGFPVLGVSSIAIPSNDSNTIYIGTGEVYGYQNSIGGFTVRTTRGSYGIGILKTTNNGATWVKALDWSANQKRGVQVVRINPKNPNVIWAGTTEGTYISRNAGANWTLLHSTLMVTDMVINPVDTGTVFIACGNLSSPGNGLYRTTNSGGNWVKLTAGLPATYGGKAVLSMYKNSPNVIYASIGNGFTSAAGNWLVKSVNNGDTWTTVSTFNYTGVQGWYSHFVGVKPNDSSKVIAAGVDIFKSTQGGYNLIQKSNWASWYFGRTPIGGPEGPPNFSHADHHSITYHPTNPDIIYFGNDGGIFKSTDGGETFEGCNGGYQTSQFYNGFSSAATDSQYAIGGMQDNATAIYDGQLAWIRVIGGDGCWTAINHRNKDTIYGESQNLNIQRSVDGGTSFSFLSIPQNIGSSFVAPYILGRVNPQIMYAGSRNIHISTNAGESWTLGNGGAALNGTNPILSLASSPLNDDIVYATTSPVNSPAKFFTSLNGGDIWIESALGLPDRYLMDIAGDPNNQAVVYVTASGYGSGHVFKSIDNGLTFTDITGNLPDVPTSSILVDPLSSNYIYVGNDIGVYVTTNGGSTWQQYVTGMPDAAIVMDLSMSPLNRKFRAVTHGSGVFERGMLDPVVSIAGNENTVKDFRLYQNYPNPFNPVTKIKFDVPSFASGGEPVKLFVYDMRGRQVAVLLNRSLSPGSYEVAWDGSTFSSGVYYYSLQAGSFTDVKKMVLLK